MKRLLVLPGFLALATLQAQAPALIDNISADQETITIHLQDGASGSARVAEFPVYSETGFPDADQGWGVSGFGGAVIYEDGRIKLTFTDPGSDPFDPYIINGTPVDANGADQLAIRVLYANPDTSDPATIGVFSFREDFSEFGYTNTTITPSSEWQTIRVDLDAVAPVDWEGNRILRLDMPDNAIFADFENAEFQIDWIALTSDPDFDATSFGPGDQLWDFEGPRKPWIGDLSELVTFSRFDGTRDRLFSRFYLIDENTTPIAGPNFVTDFESIDVGGPDTIGFYSANASMTADFSGPYLSLTYQDPAPDPFDPILNSDLLIDIDQFTHLRARVRYTNPNTGAPQPASIYFFPQGAPFQLASSTISGNGEWAILDIPLVDGTSSDPFSGRGTIRLDLPNDTTAPEVVGAELEIDWIALTSNPSLDGTNVTGDDMFWDFQGNASRDYTFPTPPTIKGLQVEWIEDAIELGVNHAGQNVVQSALFDFSNTSPITWVVDGQTFHFSPAYVQLLDDEVSKLSRSGANVYMILLNQIPTTPDPSNPLIHPLSLPDEAPNNLGAFNLTSEQGFRFYRAMVEFLAHRYSHPSSPLGRVQGYIVGNEIQSHFFWYNMGRQAPDVVMREYEEAVRMADLAVRRIAPNAKTYISMDHYWDRRPIDGANNNNRTMNGKEFLDSFAAHIRDRGDFPWHVAHHPYPHNISNPEFWGSGSDNVTFSFNTGRITYKNIEMLPIYMGYPEMLYRGERRSIILSEQGFNSPNTSNGQQRQAAAFAWGWHRVVNTEGIDAHILHRHIDNRNEGGLNLGLWTEDLDAPEISVPLAKKEIWELFKYSDTPDWQTYFDPYLPFLPISSWEEGLPSRINMVFFFDAGIQGWGAQNDVSGFTLENNRLKGTSTGNNPTLRRNGLLVPPEQVDTIVLDINANAGSQGRLFWSTSSNPGFDISRSVTFSLGSKSSHVTLDMDGVAGWSGEFITGLEVVPVLDTPGAEFSVGFIVGGLGDSLELPEARVGRGDYLLFD
ncbi:MAG: hypothetical protein JJU11_00990 [Candidatus Sumerlaeia bacterium]|nr:hypothetical protein [Candidatus Sumerlaeia bacterium]